MCISWIGLLGPHQEEEKKQREPVWMLLEVFTRTSIYFACQKLCYLAFNKDLSLQFICSTGTYTSTRHDEETISLLGKRKTLLATTAVNGSFDLCLPCSTASLSPLEEEGPEHRIRCVYVGPGQRRGVLVLVIFSSQGMYV